MIADLRAYTVYALATTGGAPKDALDAAWSSRDKLSDEGLALVGLALDAAATAALRMRHVARKESQSHRCRRLLGRELRRPHGVLGRYFARNHGLALKLLVARTGQAAYCPRLPFGSASIATAITGTRPADRHGHPGAHDYLSLSGELANTSDVEVLVNGTSVGKRHFGPGDAFALPWKLKIPATQTGSGGQVNLRKSGNGITYWSTESSCTRLTRSSSSRLNSLSTSPATTTCCRRSRQRPAIPSPTTLRHCTAQSTSATSSL